MHASSNKNKEKAETIFALFKSKERSEAITGVQSIERVLAGC